MSQLQQGCLFCWFLKDFIDSDKMTVRDWATFHQHLRMSHGWREEIPR